MNKNLPILALSAALLAGCVGKPKAPPVVYNPADVIASGKPPLYFFINRTGALNVIDVTTQSRVFHLDVAPAMLTGELQPMLLDAESQHLVMQRRVPKPVVTQPTDRYELMLPIDATHTYAVEFLPDYKATPPATQPTG